MITTAPWPHAVILSPASAITGSLRVPGSKSMGNRALLLAAVAEGSSRLCGILDADDTDAALAALNSLGIACGREGDCVTVHGCGGDIPHKNTTIRIGSSGTVGRFLPGLLAASPAGEWRLKSSPQLATRPLVPLVEALRQWGARLTQPEPERSFPLTVSGGGLKGGTLMVSAKASSQFASGALLALPLCSGPASVVIRDLDPEEAYIDMTRDLMAAFGVETRTEDERGPAAALRVSCTAHTHPLRYHAANLDIEADANTAMYFLALAALTGGSIRVANLNASSRQPGARFLDILSRMGATIEQTSGNGVAVHGNRLPLRGGFSLDMRAFSEMALTLGVLAVFADGPITMQNLAHIRGHETDRLAALARLLRLAGVAVDEHPDGVTVYPARLDTLTAPIIDPEDDHRLAMSFSLLGLAGKGITIENPGCVAKTCPDFFAMLQSLGAPVRSQE